MVWVGVMYLKAESSTNKCIASFISLNSYFGQVTPKKDEDNMSLKIQIQEAKQRSLRAEIGRPRQQGSESRLADQCHGFFPLSLR